MLRPGSSDVDVFKSPEELEYKILLKGPVVADYYDSDDNPIAKSVSSSLYPPSLLSCLRVRVVN